MLTGFSESYRREIADSFLHCLEEKQLDWKRGWNGASPFSPFNAASQHSYKGLNRFRLAVEALNNGYSDPRWCTFHQAKEKGWSIAKGEHGASVFISVPYNKATRKNISWEEFYRLKDIGESAGDVYVFAHKTVVFNAAQIVGIPALETPQAARDEVSMDELVALLAQNMQVQIINDGGNRAFYRVAEDKIHLPTMQSFRNNYEYNSTALHELAHATAAPHRLNRDLSGKFGSRQYAYEELIAEISSCFLSPSLHVEPPENYMENHKAYVQSWTEGIREAPDTLIWAISEAEKAADYMENHASRELERSDRSAALEQKQLSTEPLEKAVTRGQPPLTLNEKLEKAKRELSMQKSDATHPAKNEKERQ